MFKLDAKDICGRSGCLLCHFLTWCKGGHNKFLSYIYKIHPRNHSRFETAVFPVMEAHGHADEAVQTDLVNEKGDVRYLLT